jgi:hypothetical protein
MIDTATADRLIQQLAGRDYEAAAEKLADIGEPGLARLLQVLDGSVRLDFDKRVDFRDLDTNLCWALAPVGARCMDAFLIAVEQGNRLNSMSIVWALGLVDDSRVVEPLLVALTNKEPLVRWAAAEGLTRQKDSRAEEPLIRALRDRTSMVRGTAVNALAEFGTIRAIEPLKRVVQARSNARSPGIVSHAEQAINRILERELKRQ